MCKATRRGFLATTEAATAAGAGAAPTGSEANVYTRLGVRPIINAMGTVTILGGSIMPPEVVRAMDEASRYFVQLPELQRKAGERIAGLLGVPAAMVTAGAASAITVATAACVTLGDPATLRRLPDTGGMKNEIVQQKSHRSGYEAQMLLVGTKIVWVETREQLDAAINGRTAMMFFLNRAEPEGRIGRAEWIRVGKERGVPTFNDAAADVPPPEHLSSYVKEGFDLVAFSGGKGLLGPQCSGLLVGRKDLIEAGMPAISPAGGIGRGMKVGKEEIVGLVAAVERYLKMDHAAEYRQLERRATTLIETLGSIPGLRAKQEVPEIANHVPHVSIEWDAGRLPSARQVVEQLLAGDPPIAAGQRGERGLLISVWMMRPGEEKIVCRRLKEIFS